MEKIDKLIKFLETELIGYQNGTMMSMAESCHGENITKIFLKKVKEIRDEECKEE